MLQYAGGTAERSAGVKGMAELRENTRMLLPTYTTTGILQCTGQGGVSSFKRWHNILVGEYIWFLQVVQSKIRKT